MTKEDQLKFVEAELYFLHGKAAEFVRLGNMLAQYKNRLEAGEVEQDEFDRYSVNIQKAIDDQNLRTLAKAQVTENHKPKTKSDHATN